ncbi:hypothetical protein FHR25_002717 [Yokenella regensburgei]|jgi:hypothetical protein|nr:hypothetical protein HMPREF0880_02211 [Yokenella regensburgei ATCC 43003]KAF1368967.1 hypothetical protein FHR25_002717 [Yokenella regensburgei]
MGTLDSKFLWEMAKINVFKIIVVLSDGTKYFAANNMRYVFPGVDFICQKCEFSVGSIEHTMNYFFIKSSR